MVNERTGHEASQTIVLQQLCGNLSDEDTEYALLDRGSWQRFIGMADAHDLPDARTIRYFKKQLARTSSTGAFQKFATFKVQHWRALPDLLGLKGAQIMEILYQLTIAHHITGHPHESPLSARHRNQVACEDRV